MEQSDEGLRAAALTRESLKRKREQEEPVLASPQKSPIKAGNVTLSHEYAIPKDYVPSSELTEEVNGTLDNPIYTGKRAKLYPFKLDPFQEISIACLERKENVLVSAHTSAGKTAVAEYAVAMALRDNQKVVYTSPLKALSNQKFRELEEEFKDVGLMTGDVSINPNAPILVMTTEILRSMLYRGSEIERETAWVIFDEVHYMQDRERGVVWEETIIFLPPETRMVFLSATLSNSNQFASWIAQLRHQPCHVVYTDYRPTPLQHYAFPQGGTGLHLIKDEKNNFKSENFKLMQQSLSQKAEQEKEAREAKESQGGRFGRGRGRGRGRGGRGGDQSGKSTISVKQDTEKVSEDIVKILKMVKQRSLEPVICFSFARRECELYAGKVSQAKLDFTTDEEKDQIDLVMENALQCLSEDDRNLGAIEHVKPLLKSGVGIHHSGLLPIIKELVELLFQETLIKVLFATETFAMGLNMPARTVIFSNLYKWDGEESRVIASGEYIQMSGRAGRRGKDDRGLCIIMSDDRLTEDACREMVMGKPIPISSNFKLSYYTLLNLLRRSEGSGQDMEYVITRSFQQFQFESNLPKVKEELAGIEQEASQMKVASQSSMLEFINLRREIAAKGEIIRKEMLRPERCLQFMRPGRIIEIKEGKVNWGWGVLVRYRRTLDANVLGVNQKPDLHKILPAKVDPDAISEHYVLDILLECSPESVQSGVTPSPVKNGDMGEMHVIPVPLKFVTSISTLRINIPSDLRPPDHRKAALLTVKELKKRAANGKLPLLDPIEDFGIQDQRMMSAVHEIEKLEQALSKNDIFQTEKGADDERLKVLEHKASLQARAEELRAQMRESQLHTFKEEARNRTAVLRKLKHVDSNGLVLTKGRAACEIDTADELLTTELMFNGVFTNLDKHELVALCACLIPLGERTQEQIRMKTVLGRTLSQLQETARSIAQISNECKFPINEEEYVESFQPTLMDVVHAWSKGSSFATISEMTDVFEGSIVRFMRRLDELLSQLVKACTVVGELDLAGKFEDGQSSIRRDIIFCASLYL